jgi:CheY-like chemotaxis protein
MMRALPHTPHMFLRQDLREKKETSPASLWHSPCFIKDEASTGEKMNTSLNGKRGEMTGGKLPARRPAGGSITVLVVDDNQMVRALATEVLKGQGYAVLEAKNAYSALALAASWTGPIDVVLAGIVMPYLNGIEFIEHLKAVRNDFRVLFMSSHLNDLIPDQERWADETHFIGKPFKAADLIRKIGDLVAKGPR